MAWALLVLFVSVAAQVQVEQNLFLVSTSDGLVHALDSRGTQRWALNTGTSFLKTYYANDVFEKEHEVILPTVEGDLVVISNGVFRKSESGVKELVDECPRLRDGVYLVGEKKIRAYSVETHTGRLLAAYIDSKAATIALSAAPVSRDTLLIGLVEYTVQALDINTFEPRWNMSYTEMIPTSNKRPSGSAEPIEAQLDIVMKSLQMTKKNVVSVNALSESSGLIHPVDINGKKSRNWVKVRKTSEGIYADIVDQGGEDEGTALAPLELPTVSQRALPMPLGLEDGGADRMLVYVLTAVSISLLVLLYNSTTKPSKPLSISSVSTTAISVRKDLPAPQEPVTQKRIGKLLVHLDRKLGDGSHGTAVFEGFFMDREVAVKRMLLSLYFSAKQEVSLLLKADSHPNVVTYHAWEEDSDFIYLVIEKCCGTLGDVIDALAMTNKRKKKAALSRFPVLLDVISLLRDSAAGLAYLHSHKIVHRDVKPMNILIDARGRAKIADMAGAKALRQDQSSYGTQAHGSSGWQPPEVLLNKRRNCSVDVFSLGCTFYCALQPGKHPFGDRLQRDQNILEGKSDLEGLDAEATHLISRMICPQPEKRPSAAYICGHPMFWNAQKKLDFLVEFSDRLEAEGNGCKLEVDFEASLASILPEPWSQSLASEFIASLEKYRKYNFLSIKDLLRVIRNKKNHYHDLSDEAKAVVGEVPTGYYNYFIGVYPALLMRIFNFVETNLSSDLFYLKYVQSA